MDNLRVGTRDPILLLTRSADKLVSLKPGEVVRARVAELLPGGEVNLLIQGNLFRARSSLQLPEDASVLFRVLGQQSGESGSEIRLQFLEVIAPTEAGRLPQKSAVDPLQDLTQELTSNLAAKAQMPAKLTAIVEQLLKALPEDASRIPSGTREQLLTLLQTSLRNTGQSIQDRLNLFFQKLVNQDNPLAHEIAEIREQVFADIETISQVPLEANLANSGVGLEAKVRALAEAPVEAGSSSLRALLPPFLVDQPVESFPLSPELKDALVELNRKGIPLPPELKDALMQLDQKGVSLSPELKDALRSDPRSLSAQANMPVDPLQSDFKARLLRVRESLLEQQDQLLKLDPFARTADGKPVSEKKALLEQMLQSIDGLLKDVETFQLLSKLTDSFYTFLPFIWKGLREAEIAFKSSRGGPQGRSYYCLVHLDLEELGKLETIAMMAGSEFLVSFKTDHDAFRSVLNANLNELREMFAAKGLNLGMVNFYRMEEKQLEPFERLEAFESIISIRI